MSILSKKQILSAERENQPATRILLCEQWLQIHPDDLGVIFTYAEMLYSLARFDESLAILRKAEAQFPAEYADICIALGNLHRYRGAFAEAEVHYHRAMEEDPDEPISYVFLAAVQARQGKLAIAESTLRKAVRCRSKLLDEAYHNLGLVLRGQGRLAEAKSCFEKAIDIDPDYETAIEALGDVTSALEMQKEDPSHK